MSADLGPCPICKSRLTYKAGGAVNPYLMDCVRCGKYTTPIRTEMVVLSALTSDKRALASHHIRLAQNEDGVPFNADDDFIASVRKQELPDPLELCDNLLLVIGERLKGRPGKTVSVPPEDLPIQAIVGVVDEHELDWATQTLVDQGLIERSSDYEMLPTVNGWQRYHLLRNAKISSRYAFLARQFSNPELDKVLDECIRPAVRQTGFEIRPVSQKAGHIDALIEDEIRRSKFVIADLSDSNCGAYWEAGFAEGLGKPVIYISRGEELGRAAVISHFDTAHRHTVRWYLSDYEKTAKTLKAVIRNTLLGEAKQSDD